MRPMSSATYTTTIFAVLAALGSSPVQGQESAPREVAPAHVHIRHVAESFRGTPDRQGILATATAEAEIALQHATLAARDVTNLEAMQRHAGHVINALDPTAVEDGPGLGYGMIEAARRAAHYTELAIVSVGAGDAIQTHGPHVATAARSAVAMAEEALEVADAVVDAETAEEAAELVARLQALTDAVVNGVDADADGRVGWQEGEGGLAQATQHLGLLMRGEGLASGSQ